MTITFRATSNDVQPSEQAAHDFQASASPAHGVISNHKAFHKAFGIDVSKPGAPPLSKSVQIIQSSDHVSDEKKMMCPAANHGFVDCVIQAYNHHFDLVLRPDDVWQAILTQFSFYVNANSEELRDSLVDFQGKKELVVMAAGTLFTVDFGTLAKRMVDEQIKHNIKDAAVADWLLPGFTTTTETDRIVASISIMSTLQTYFSYVFRLRCGIPNVTLEGTPEDWIQLREKLDKLTEFEVKHQGGAETPKLGSSERNPRSSTRAKMRSPTVQKKGMRDSPKSYMAKWRALLVLIVDEFVASSKGNVNLHFWDTVCSHHGGGSGPTYLSGWITAFCCFSADGKWQILDPSEKDENNNKGAFAWPKLDTNDIPIGVISVPVKVDDNGTEYETQMVAGQFGYEYKNPPSVQPRSDWCIAYDTEKQR